MENFDPSDPKYKKVEDLPVEEREKYRNVENGFITLEASRLHEKQQQSADDTNIAVPFYKKLFTTKLRPQDVAQVEAEKEKPEYEMGLKNQKVEKEKQKAQEAEEKTRQELEIKQETDQKERQAKIDALPGNADEVVGRIKNGGLREIKKIFEEINGADIAASDDSVWEYFIGILRGDKSYTEIMEACLDAYVAHKDDFSNWGHTLSHLFPERSGESSIFDNPENFRSIKKIVDEAVRRSISEGTLGYLPSVVLGIITCNRNNFNVDNLDGEFTFKPESISRPEFIDVYNNDEKSKYYPQVLKFIEAKTPREYLKYLVEQGERLDIPDLQTEVAILKSLQKDIPQDKWEAYLSKYFTVNGEKLPLSEIADNITEAEGAMETVDGIYVDVDGTLIKDGLLQEIIVKKIEKESKGGKEIIIFSGGNPESRTEQLKALGFPDKFLPVRSKDDFKGKVLESLIDDTKPQYQGLSTKNYSHPDWVY